MLVRARVTISHAQGLPANAATPDTAKEKATASWFEKAAPLDTPESVTRGFQLALTS